MITKSKITDCEQCFMVNPSFTLGRVTKKQMAQKIGKHISSLRKQIGWSQSELARQCEKDRQTIGRIENGIVTPSAYTLFEISSALQVRFCYLLNICD